MMRSLKLVRVSMFVTVVVLVACQSADETSITTTYVQTSSIQTSIPIVTGTATAPPTEQPSPTVSNTKTPYPSTPVSQRSPDIFKSPVAKDLLFSEDRACRLPCWYGLRVGMSRVEDILRSLKQAVGASEDYVFLMGEDPQSQDTDPGYISFQWRGDPLPGGRPALFTTNSYFNPQTDVLSFMQIYSTLPLFTEQTMPQRVLKELGRPSDVRILLQTLVEDVSHVSLDIVLLYKGTNNNEAMDFDWSTYIPVDMTKFPNGPRVARWCLGGGPKQVDASFMLQIPTLDTPEARAWFQNDTESVEQVFGITSEDLYQRVLHEENTCLTHEF